MRRPCARGFTLIELLVVVTIIAVVVAGALLSMSALGQDRELETESERLVTLMNYAREQAELQTRELGLYCGSHRYQFLAFDPLKNQWADIGADDALRAREVPVGLTLSLVVEGREVVLDKVPDAKKVPADELRPHVMIFSNGDLTSFSLSVARDGTQRVATLTPDEQGRIAARTAQQGKS
ncbi:MAG: type II secretion system minor pseudopilin GspH [Acetobacteraceae bacterium]|nr:type II secretion system minor pseudopilin GspH [Acetobacteraceae bacterium]